MTLFKAIVQGKYKLKPLLSKDAKDLIRKIMVGPAERLGCMGKEHQEIKDHKWLKGMDWHALHDKEVRHILFLNTALYFSEKIKANYLIIFVIQIKAPWLPNCDDPLDCSEFDNWDHMNKDSNNKPLTEEEQEDFKEFDEILNYSV